METPDLEEVLNDHVKLEISLVKDADDNPAAINNALVGSEIFTAARTHSQVTGPNFSSQREEAVRGTFYAFHSFITRQKRICKRFKTHQTEITSTSTVRNR